ncbi:homoserine dehydrogenase [Paraflavisolibacter sp. H34]|uniref:homoserine dehydrogenase n=1 Tax=Huijunlia imazamoxiresistens TaxID=3127457 RepID=UPI0030179FC6
MSNKKLTIGLFGFGVVGEALYQVLRQTPSLQAEIKKVCIQDSRKKRNAPPELFTTDRDELLNDPAINVIVEVINEADAAFAIVSTALRNGKQVVSASKKMIAAHLTELLRLQQQTGGSLLYEAAACASIPIVRNLEEYYDNDLLHALRGIVNGSTNYILTRMTEDRSGFPQALIAAQAQGFAEKDPALDVQGHDAAHKWCLLLAHAYGIVTGPDDLLFTGIQQITATDVRLAREKNCVIRLVAQARKLRNGRIAAYVLPQFVPATDTLFAVSNEYNGVELESHFADRQFFYGKGAGGFPTASALLSDIAALRYGYKYEYKKLRQQEPATLCEDYHLRVFVRFSNRRQIPRERFEWIEKIHEEEQFTYLTGVIAYRELKEGNWWKEHHTSLILLPEAIEESVEIRRLKRRSLELGGVAI